LDASTAANFTGTIYSSTTFLAANSTLTVSGLAAFTTYYLRVGDLNWNNATNYASIGSTMTTSGGAVGSPSISAVYLSTITATSFTFNSGSAVHDALPYELDASTAANFTGTIYSSTTFLAANSTLTVSGLAAFTTYYLRVGDLNWNNATNYVSIGSTMTTSGGAVGKIGRASGRERMNTAVGATAVKRNG